MYNTQTSRSGDIVPPERLKFCHLLRCAAIKTGVLSTAEV